MAVLPVVDQSAEDDSTPTDVFTVITWAIVRRTAYFASNSLLQHPVEFLAARVVVAMVVWPHSRVHRGHLSLSSRALRRHLDRYHNSIYPSFNPSTSISTVLKLWYIRDSHRPTRYFLGVRDPRVIRLQVPRPVPVAQVRVVVEAKEKPWGRHMQFRQIMTP